MKSKKTVFLTGATGTMGHAGLVELSKRLDRFNITLLARPSKINKEKLATYEAMQGIRIVWRLDELSRCLKWSNGGGLRITRRWNGFAGGGLFP